MLGIETLSRLINKVVEGAFMYGFRFKSRRGQEVCVSHRLFADNTLIFCKDNEEEMNYLSWTLMWFEAAFVLRINMEKSSIILVGRVENVESMAREVGCKVGDVSTPFRSNPIGGSEPNSEALAEFIYQTYFI